MNHDDLEDGTWEDDDPMTPEEITAHEAHNRMMLLRLIAAVETNRAIAQAKATQ